MSPLALSSLAVLAASLSMVGAQSTFPATPLASKHFAYPTGIPYQADTEPNLIRGGQLGYNMCNSTTENQNSLCQTLLFNSLDNFCIWGPPEPNSDVGSHEGEMIAWCSKPGYGTRLIPEGTLKGLQLTKTPDYIQIVGFIDQTKINLADGDYGGELDPHGADLRGNPLGGLVYSNAWSGSNDSYTQVMEWHNFVGTDFFCFKACDPAGANAAHFCEHIYDRIGCAYNAPNNAQENVFEACDGDSQAFPGVYSVNGVTMTYTQPPEDAGAIATMPYDPVVPASSNCRQYQSSELFGAIATVAASGASHTATSAHATGSATGTRSGSAAAAGATNGASTLAFSTISLAGVIFSTLFLS